MYAAAVKGSGLNLSSSVVSDHVMYLSFYLLGVSTFRVCDCSLCV